PVPSRASMRRSDSSGRPMTLVTLPATTRTYGSPASSTLYAPELPRQEHVVGPAPEDHARPQLVNPAAELAQDAPRVLLVGGLEDRLAVDPGNGIRSE